jgi:hypothetical protein
MSNNGESKMDKAVKIYQRMMKRKNIPTRKEVLEAFQNEAGLTKAGASAYYHTIKKREE